MSFYNLVGIAQLVRASDCGPEGRRFNSDFPPHVLLLNLEFSFYLLTSKRGWNKINCKILRV